jgi:hypothetical protein
MRRKSVIRPPIRWFIDDPALFQPGLAMGSG